MGAFDLGNPGRGAARVAMSASAAVESARTSVREFVGWGTVCFTPGTTASLNIALRGWNPRPVRVAIDPLAHNAVRRTLAAIGAETWVLPHDREGVVDLGSIASAWRGGTSLVVVTHGSNVTGGIQPLAAIAKQARRLGASVLVDAAQTAGLLPIDIDGVDAMAFSAHKALRALPGCGVLVVRDGSSIDPLITGGTGGDSMSLEMPQELPARLEAGTPNVPGIVALGASARASTPRPAAVADAAARLREAVVRAELKPLATNHLPVVSFELPGYDARTVEEVLDRSFDIVTRAGLHCAPAAHAVLGTSDRGTLRVSAGEGTTQSDLDGLTRALRELRRSQALRRDG
jgi:selenocysteine lyase/cysteine desulfurase